MLTIGKNSKQILLKGFFFVVPSVHSNLPPWQFKFWGTCWNDEILSFFLGDWSWKSSSEEREGDILNGWVMNINRGVLVIYFWHCLWSAKLLTVNVYSIQLHRALAPSRLAIACLSTGSISFSPLCHLYMPIFAIGACFLKCKIHSWMYIHACIYWHLKYICNHALEMFLTVSKLFFVLVRERQRKKHKVMGWHPIKTSFCSPLLSVIPYTDIIVLINTYFCCNVDQQSLPSCCAADKIINVHSQNHQTK